MRQLVASVGDLLSYSEVAYDHTPIQFGGSSQSFTRAPKGASDVYIAQSNNAKLSFTYVLCSSKKHGLLPRYYKIPEHVASKATIRDYQSKGIIPPGIRIESNESGWADKKSGIRIIRMLLNDIRFRKGMPVRVITDAHKSSTTEAISTLLAERGARMQFVLSGATQHTQFIDIRGGAAQALKNGGENSRVAVLRRFYDESQNSRYKRHYSASGSIMPMTLPDCINMVERAVRSHVTENVRKRS